MGDILELDHPNHPSHSCSGVGKCREGVGMRVNMCRRVGGCRGCVRGWVVRMTAGARECCGGEGVSYCARKGNKVWICMLRCTGG